MMRKTLVLVVLLLMAVFSRAQADSASKGRYQVLPASNRTGTPSNVARLKVPDLELLNQDGENGRFMSDFIGDHLAAVTFTYTTCTTACPILDSIFQRVQAKLGERLGKDIILITISIDPVTDIPPRLKAHADKLKAQPGWRFLTGEKQSINRILKALEVYSTDIYNHPPTVFVVDGRQGGWTRFNGYPSTTKIMNEFDRLNGLRAQNRTL